MGTFKIDADNLTWIGGQVNDAEDLCLHGHAVAIVGCPNGIDWTVLHEGDKVKLITEDGEETVVDMVEYRAEVFRFADKIEAFYESATPKIMPKDRIDRDGYVAFWNEWRRRRGQQWKNGMLIPEAVFVQTTN